MEKLLNMTVSDLLDQGAEVEIVFFNTFDTTFSEAKEQIEQFGLEYEKKGSRMTEWLQAYALGGDVSVSAHYYKQETETESNLTEYERKMKETGHKESDFR